MVKEIVRVGLEVVSVENPSAIGNGDTELMLLVALTPQRKEATIVRCAEPFQRASNREQWRRLVVVSVEGAERPIQAGKIHRCAEARADRVFRIAAAEVRWAYSGGER